MGLELINIVDTIEIMENYLFKIRPPEHIREKLDIGYRIDNQSVILFEIRPMFKNPDKNQEHDYAKATFIKGSNKWRVYWRRANLKWYPYEHHLETSSLIEFVNLVEEDKYYCFKG